MHSKIVSAGAVRIASSEEFRYLSHPRVFIQLDRAVLERKDESDHYHAFDFKLIRIILGLVYTLLVSTLL